MQSGAGTNDDIARVLASTDIVRLIGDHVSVKKKGREFVCICPFHDDHSPSMTIAPSKGIYKCFACGAGGDAIKFVREYHKLSFREALQFLADRSGITLTPWRPTHTGPGYTTGDDAESASREDLRAANRTACEFFQVLLRHPEHGQLARSVIEKREVSPEMVARFQLGSSPDMWDGLLKLIQSKKLELKPFLGASLLRTRESGNSYFDFFRNRLMFPIHDQAGHVIGFGARKLREEDEPKYLNSPETILFNKSETLYGIYQAADTIRKSEQAVLVEGYMDVIACHQAGITNAVAALGTSLTAQGATRLARQCSSVVLLFDGDEAGAKAADRAVEVFFASPMDVKIATLSAARARGEITAKDPDELLKQPGGSDKLRSIIAQASDALEYRMARLRQRLGAMSGTAKSQAVEEELKRLAELGLSRIPPIRREMVLKQIAVALGVSESLVRASVPFGRELGPSRRTQPAEPARTEPLKLALKSSFDVLLACALSEPTLLRTLSVEHADVLSPDRFDHPMVKSAASAVSMLIADPQADRPRLAGALHEVEGESAAAELISQIDQRTRGDSKSLQRNWTEALALAPKELAFARARASGDFDRIREAKLSLEHARATLPELLLK